MKTIVKDLSPETLNKLSKDLVFVCICLQIAMTAGVYTLEADGLTGQFFQLHLTGLAVLVGMYKLAHKKSFKERALGLISLIAGLSKIVRKILSII